MRQKLGEERQQRLTAAMRATPASIISCFTTTRGRAITCVTVADFGILGGHAVPVG
jgi:hypothetical protein